MSITCYFMCSTISFKFMSMSISRNLVFCELLKCNGGKLTNLTSIVHRNWGIVSIQKLFYAVSHSIQNCQRKSKNDVCLPNDNVFQIYLYMIKLKYICIVCVGLCFW